jgi:Domain of unknown function (DUF4349)/Putative zinc-finger
MTSRHHPIEAEALMAYLDGELATEQATAAANHLETCMECQQLTAELHGVSQAVNMWEVASLKSAAIPSAIAAALDAGSVAPSHLPLSPRSWSAHLRYLLKDWSHPLAACSAVAVLIVGSFLFVARNNNRDLSEVASPTGDRANSRTEIRAHGDQTSGAQARKAEGLIGGRIEIGEDKNGLPQGFTSATSGPVARQSVATYLDGQTSGKAQQPETANALTYAPMIIRTASLAVTTKDFDKARAQVEEVLKRHRGYVGSLNVTANPGAGRTLSATLRIPSTQLDAAIVDLKTLGRLDSESQNGEDVTSQYVDLNARLDNSRHTEQRLTDLLQNRTGKLSDVLSVENELARVRGEIESMEAERKTMANQVDFATLNLALSEDYRAQLQVVPPSTFTRLSNAAVEGYRNLTDGLMAVALFFLASGPSLLLWAAILFFPVRLVWKKLRHSVAQ